MNKSISQPIEKQVERHIQACFSSSNPKIVIGVSGGPDSMALLHILLRLSVPVVIGHLNYQKRGQDSEKDQQLVEEYAEKKGIPFYVTRPEQKAGEAANFQEWAREVRLDFLQDLLNREEGDAIALAHHRNDQIETIIQKLFRGAGPGGWSGMKLYDPPIFRPLLEVSQPEIQEYIDEWNIPHRIDKSNLAPQYARNFIRNEWIPELDRWFPGWRSNILELPEKSDVFTSVIRTLLQSAATGKDRLKRKQVLDWKPEVKIAVLLRWIKDKYPDASVSGSALEELDNLGSLQTGQSLQLTSQLYIMRDRESFALLNAPHNYTEEKGDVESFVLTREALDSGSVKHRDFVFEIKWVDNFTKPGQLSLSVESLEWPITVRTWKPGDRFQPFGMEGHQKVKDHLTNRKISAARKKEARVLETGKGKIAAVLYPPGNERREPGTIAESARCSSKASEALVIQKKS